MNRYFLVLFFGLSGAASASAEDIVVVANPNSGVNKFSRNEVIDIFMGRNRQFSSGVTALPLDLPDALEEHEKFYLRLTGKSINEINAYWARLRFTGRAFPPALAQNQDEAIQKVMDNRGALAYVSRDKVSSKVKVVFELNDK